MRRDVHEQLRALARTSCLLVACDYDGTLSEFVTNPADAAPDAGALTALRALSDVPRTTTAVVSGRAFKELAGFLGGGVVELLVGSHGAEWGQAGVGLTGAQRDLLGRITRTVELIAGATHGARCERKPAAVALHVRVAERRAAAAAIAEAVARCGKEPGVYVRHGCEVVEFMVVEANKGEAVGRARVGAGATAVLFVGDDLTDEDVFASLAAEDVSIKVGPGDTAATHRVAGVPDVAEVLGTLAALRVDWLKTQGHHRHGG